MCLSGFFVWAHATCSATDRLFLTWIMETEADDSCVYLHVCVCEEPSAYKATTAHLTGKTDEFPASDSAVSQLLITEKCTLSMQ